MDQLKPESLDWALTHIKRFGDTDIFPVPFEYKAIEHDWTGIRDKLARLDIAEYECRTLRRFLIPKPGIGYRAAIQLDPLDTLIYTALVYEAAELIEQYRTPRHRQIACSYRVEIDAKGQLFRSANGWDDFRTKSTELAESGQYAYVLVADIADFYNQISSHRVRNALEASGVASERAQNIEDFLMNLAGRYSRGIPVGPSGSILLAEACLADVDSFLLRKGYEHTRYVDDFRVFCRDYSEANHALHDLSEYLYTSHRLALQSGKTDIMPIDKFAAAYLVDPEEVEQTKKTQKISIILQQLSRHTVYGTATEDDLSPEELREVVKQNLIELFDACLASRPLQLGTARYLLRRAAALRTAVLQRRALENLDLLTPVFRDAATYVMKTVQAKSAQPVAEALMDFMATSDLAFIPFVHLWITQILTEKLATMLPAELHRSVLDVCEKSRICLGTRPFCMLARNLGYVDFVREQRETWQNNTPWDRRAVIWAATVLSRDEKTYWLSAIKNSADLLDQAVAKAVDAGL
jgi:hypothetical protein